MSEKFDAIVVGAGQAGPFLAVRLAEAGQKVAFIERRRLGGTCVNDGCTPTKALVASARAAWMARNGARYGVDIAGSITVDMKRVKARKDAVVEESRSGLDSWVKGTKNLELIIDQGRFESPSSIRVGDRVLESKQIFLNVGARAIVPDLPGVNDGPYLTNSSIVDLDVLPEHLIVLGGSYIALEFAQMYRRFGSKVTVVERGPRLISREDEDVSSEILKILKDEDLTILLGAKAERVEHANGRVTLVTDQGRIEGTHLLFGIGRIPNTGDLGVEKAGLVLDPHGYLEVDDQLRTKVLEYGPLVIATVAARSRIRRTTTSRSSPRTCSTTIRGGSPTAIRSTGSSSIRRSAASG